MARAARRPAVASLWCGHKRRSVFHIVGATLLGDLALAAASADGHTAAGLGSRSSGGGQRLRGGAGAGAGAAKELGTEAGLRLVDAFLEGRPRQEAGEAPRGHAPSLLQTYGPEIRGGGGPCGAFCELQPSGRFDIYDSAVSAIYWTYRGRLREAERIVAAFERLLYARDDLAGNYSYGPEHGLVLPPGHRLTLLASAYTNVSGEPGVYSGPGIADGSVDTGNNVWAALAMVHFSVFAGRPCYEVAARNVLRALAASASCQDELGGLMGRLSPHARFYRSTEHNVDVFALSRMLGERAVEERARRFVQAMYGYGADHNASYATGTQGDGPCNATSLPAMAADAQFWSVLAGADPDREQQAAALLQALRPVSEGGLLSYDDDVIGPAGNNLEGIRFTSTGSGAQWENTAAASLALERFSGRWGGQGAGLSAAAAAAAEEAAPRLRRSVLRLLGAYGAVPGSVRGGNYLAYAAWKEQNASGLERLREAWEAWKDNASSADVLPPGGSATGIGWTYLRVAHTAATAWTGLALLGVNPYEAPVTIGHTAAPASHSCRPGSGQ